MGGTTEAGAGTGTGAGVAGELGVEVVDGACVGAAIGFGLVFEAGIGAVFETEVEGVGGALFSIEIG